MRKTLLVCFGCLWSIMGPAQNDCAEAIKLSGTYFFGTANTKPDHAKAYTVLQDCANQGDAVSLALSADMLQYGVGVEKNENLAFEYMMKAAQQEYGYAEYKLGLFYRSGIGCPIDLVSSVVWLARSSNHGNKEAAYFMGYNFLKGQGVPQSYEAALSWFEQSPNPMAKHWLGYCHYFGYGVPKDTQKAIAYCNQSGTPNSKQLLKHIAENTKDKVDTAISKQIKEKETHQNTGIAQAAIEKTTIQKGQPTTSKTFKRKHLDGKWKGKLIALEWSGKQITEILPISCEFAAQGNNKVSYQWEINNTICRDTARWGHKALYFKQLKMVFDWPFSDIPSINTIDWILISAQMELKTVNKKNTL
ncbi:tetratricopeptide repeat protein [Mariniflexile sp. HMF6888]|uniref:tetratricopeptide repeat protein n=1 Tax=Mariniflexile sp. HMF6888 TaxID=3373086 RepID=UPI00378E33E6